MLPEKALSESEKAAMRADVFISAGTSGEVYPAAGLPELARRHGAVTVDVNPNETPLSISSDYYLQGTSGEVLPLLLSKIKERKQ
jgi:NAD-dependent deacetylase